ncbi:MAG: metallophosphoesterase family protein [Candidatus Omnitrophica bacterium]|nr:metallophosphoesterase family protein [Candidatus Omnitrophota bacterium]
MTRVLVLSDTHIPINANSLPKIITCEAKKSDYCIHAGDICSFSVIKTLSSLTTVYAVCGNMDDLSVSEKLPHKQIFTIEDVKIGLVHGRGTPSGIFNIIDREFPINGEKLDIIVFGHSHAATNEVRNGRIYFNPGSSTDKDFAAYKSYGILEIDGKSIERRIEIIE